MIDDRKFLQAKDWPLGDRCALKNLNYGQDEKPRTPGDFPLFGIVFDDDLSTVYRGPEIMSPRSKFKVLKKYPSIDDLLADGWIVD